MESPEEKIIHCFKNLGVIVDGHDNFLIGDYIEDSLTYTSFLVELEQMFVIDIPDEYLAQGRLETFEDIKNMVESLT
jgi:acyl carrier protein